MMATKTPRAASTLTGRVVGKAPSKVKSASIALERIKADLAGKPLEPGGAQPVQPLAVAPRPGTWKRKAVLALVIWGLMAPLLAYWWGERQAPAQVAAAVPVQTVAQAQPDLNAIEARNREWAAVIRAGMREDIEALRPDFVAINKTVAEAVRLHLAARDAKCVPAPRTRSDAPAREPAASAAPMLPHEQLLGLGRAMAAAP